MTETGPPPAHGYDAPQGPSGPRANFGWRLVAVIVDSIITSVMVLVPLFALAAIDEKLGTLGYLIGLIVSVAYFTYFEGGPAGQTLGKKAAGIRVIDFNTGGSIGYGRAVGRYFARYLSSLPCALGYLWMLWDREKQTWHDKLVNCVVVPTDAYPVE